jgi:glycosyltransferase involved in cell wall biosynthesis
MAKITIIITAYRDRGWINEAIFSALNQTFDDYDIVFCSDGNKELKKYADEHGIRFILAPKGNYSTAVNYAMTKVTGEWIKVLHDDDLLTETCLADLYYARGDADLVYANAICFNNDDFDSANTYKPPKEITFKMLLPIITNPVNFEAELFKREMFIEIGGFDENLGYAEDYDLLLNLISKGYKTIYCDKDVVWYRHHPRQITGNEPAMRQREQDYLRSKYMDVIVNQIKW